MPAAGTPGCIPHQPLDVRLQNAIGLSRSCVKTLLSHLNTVAKAYADDDQISAFALADAGAEYLQTNNFPARETQVRTLAGSPAILL